VEEGGLLLYMRRDKGGGHNHDPLHDLTAWHVDSANTAPIGRQQFVFFGHDVLVYCFQTFSLNDLTSDVSQQRSQRLSTSKAEAQTVKHKLSLFGLRSDALLQVPSVQPRFIFIFP